MLPIAIGLVLSLPAEATPVSPWLSRAGFEQIALVRGVKVYKDPNADIIRLAAEGRLPAPPHKVQARQAWGLPTNCRVIIAGPPPPGRTGKLNAMMAGLREARGELIAFADSDIRPDQRTLTVLVETLLSAPDAGSAFAPVVATQPPRTVGDAGYALLMSGMYGPVAAAVAKKNGGSLPFIMGQFMVFRREALAAIGGLESAQGQLVDDMYLGARLNIAGYRNLLAPHPMPVIQEGLSFSEFIQTFVRWIAFSRTGLPNWSFKWISWLQGIVFWLGLVTFFIALAQGFWLAALLNGLAPLGVATSTYLLHRTFGGSSLAARHLWVPFGLLLLAPIVLIRVHLRHEINWRGRKYKLNAEARLAEGKALSADHG